MILRPDGEFKLSCYVDSDFGCLFGSENPGDPVSVNQEQFYQLKWTPRLILNSRSLTEAK